MSFGLSVPAKFIFWSLAYIPSPVRKITSLAPNFITGFKVLNDVLNSALADHSIWLIFSQAIVGRDAAKCKDFNYLRGCSFNIFYSMLDNDFKIQLATVRFNLFPEFPRMAYFRRHLEIIPKLEANGEGNLPFTLSILQPLLKHGLA